MLTFTAARWVLVLHTALGVAAVGSGTHLVIWLRRYLGGAVGRRRAVLKFAWIFFALQLAAFGAGNLMYPTYKVEVRAAYLENPGALASEQAVRDRTLYELELKQHGEPRAMPATAELVKRAAQAARWFDVKEHWIALGLFASAGLLLILVCWDPFADGRAFASIVTGLAWIACGTVWLGAVIGVLTAAWRAI
ncbi:MAG: hypothetical protein ABI678_23595 [Kofleriaceae bacterium]